MVGAHHEVGVDAVRVLQIGSRLLRVEVEDADLVDGRVHDGLAAVRDRNRAHVDVVVHSRGGA